MAVADVVVVGKITLHFLCLTFLLGTEHFFTFKNSASHCECKVDDIYVNYCLFKVIQSYLQPSTYSLDAAFYIPLIPLPLIC